MNSSNFNSTSYPLPETTGDIVGSIAHACVGIVLIIWGSKCLAGFSSKNHLERFLYIWIGFWEFIGPVFLLSIPELCYHSQTCLKRNLTHVLASFSVWLGVVWDIIFHKKKIPQAFLGF